MSRFAWILGAVGVLALLAFGAHAATSEVLDPWWSGAGIAGALLCLAWMWIDRDALGRYAGSRGGRYTATATALVGVAAGVAVALNVLAQRHDQRWDITSSQKYALSEQTVKVLGGLDREVRVLGFFPPGTPDRIELQDLLDGYTAHTGLLKVSFHDPLAEPLLAREHQITSNYGAVVLQAGDEKQRIESGFDEEALTNALIRLTAGRSHELCFTSGHEELDPDDDQSTTGLGLAVLKLEGQNYTAARFIPFQEGRVPPSCDVVVIADPQVDWLPPEREILARHLAEGGKVLALLEPARVPGLAADFARYNVAVGDDILLEQNPNLQLVGGDPSYIFVDKTAMDHHPLTNPLKGAVLFRVARSVGVADPGMEGLQAQELLRTSEYGWAETRYLDPGGLSPDPAEDRVGRVPMMVSVEITDPAVIQVGAGRPDTAPALPTVPVAALAGAPPVDPVAASPEAPAALPGAGADTAVPPRAGAASPAPAAEGPPVARKAGGRIIVIGDAEFASNELLDQASNQDLFLNAVAWLAGEEDQVSIRPNPAAAGTFTMTLIQGLLVFVISLIVAPGLALMGAISTWMQRRRL